MTLTHAIGRTLRVDAESARGNDAASAVTERCLPKPLVESGPEEHGSEVHPRNNTSQDFCNECQKLKPCCCG